VASRWAVGRNGSAIVRSSSRAGAATGSPLELADDDGALERRLGVELREAPQGVGVGVGQPSFSAIQSETIGRRR
jgi:hypothetical protein